MEKVVKAATSVAIDTTEKCSKCDGCCELSTAEQVDKKASDPTFKIGDPSATEQVCIACTVKRSSLSIVSPSPGGNEEDLLLGAATHTSVSSIWTLLCMAL